MRCKAAWSSPQQADYAAVQFVADCDLSAAMQYHPHLRQRATAASGASRAATSMARTLTRRAWRWPALTQVCPWHLSSSARFCGPPVGHCRASSWWLPPRPSCQSSSAVIACPASPHLPAIRPVCSVANICTQSFKLCPCAAADKTTRTAETWASNSSAPLINLDSGAQHIRPRCSPGMCFELHSPQQPPAGPCDAVEHTADVLLTALLALCRFCDQPRHAAYRRDIPGRALERVAYRRARHPGGAA